MDGGLPHGRTGRQDAEAALTQAGPQTQIREDSHSRRDFILANTTLIPVPLVPEIRLHLAHEAHELWLRTEEELQQIGLPPPFWAFAWAGGQALARYILDNPQTVAGKSVLDLATGSGLVAIAASLAGAAQVTANDVDPFAMAALSLNMVANGVDISANTSDYSNAAALPIFDVVLAGDIFYDRELADRFWPLLQDAATSGTAVLIGDPGRAYLPGRGLEQLGEYEVPVTRALEDSEIKRTRVWRAMSG